MRKQSGFGTYNAETRKQAVYDSIIIVHALSFTLPTCVHCTVYMFRLLSLHTEFGRDTKFTVSLFLPNRTIGRAFGTLCRLSVVCNILYCGETVRPSEKLSEGVNRKPGTKS